MVMEEANHNTPNAANSYKNESGRCYTPTSDQQLWIPRTYISSL